jgi:ABC-type oligopeptide transport system substrate-binding subunit
VAVPRGSTVGRDRGNLIVNIRERGILAAAVLVLVIVAGALIISGPAAGPVASPTPSAMTAERILRVGTVGSISTLDPLYATDPAERDAIALLFRGLTRLGPAGTIQPDWPVPKVSATGTWTFDCGRTCAGTTANRSRPTMSSLPSQPAAPGYDGRYGNVSAA